MSETIPAPAPYEIPLGEAATIATAVANDPETPAKLVPVAKDVATVATALQTGNGLSSLASGLIRTATPLAVGALITYLSTINVAIPKADEVLLDTGGVFVIGSAYYFIVRKLETKWPKLGWLLGRPVQPVYGS